MKSLLGLIQIYKLSITMKRTQMEQERMVTLNIPFVKNTALSGNFSTLFIPLACST